MDDNRFDAMVRALGTGTSRRGALGVLAGITGLGLSEVAAKRRHVSGAQRGKQRSSGRVQAPKAGKVAVCHYDADADTHVLIHVSRRGWENGHAKHEGDFLRGGGDNGGDVGCCADGECGALSNACGPGVCDPATRTCAGPCGEGEQCIGNACEAVCAERFTSNVECGCFRRVGAATSYACLWGRNCSPTCASDAECTNGAVCAWSPCCGNPPGLGAYVCQPPCAHPDDCTCTSGREICNLEHDKWVRCGLTR